MKGIRLARYLAQCGVASRRTSESHITDGEVTVNGSVVTKVGTTVDPTSDVILFRGKRVAPEKLVYYVVHKPVDYVCSTKDAHADKLVTDLVPGGVRLYPVGRLDKDSSGLVILTNDGELAQRMMHPKYEKQKVYEVQTEGVCTEDFLKCMKRGVKLDEGRARADSIRKLSRRSFELTIHQGWKRQIRRMVQKCGAEVTTLKRIKEGSVELGSLEVGRYVQIDHDDIR